MWTRREQETEEQAGDLFFQEMSKVRAQLESDQAAKDSVFPIARRLKHQVDLTLIRFFSGDASFEAQYGKIKPVAVELVEQLEQLNSPTLRNAGAVTNALADAHALDCLVHFVRFGELNRARHESPVGSLAGVSDQAYLGGLISMAKHLERYAVGRATHGDRSSVIACQKFVEALLEKLMEFDFRNGPLRRAYDGVKYVNKRLGDIMYETLLSGGGKRLLHLPKAKLHFPA